MTRQEKLQALAGKITTETLAHLQRQYPNYPDWTDRATATIKPGNKYAKVDVGLGSRCSGKYMVDETGNIYGIKAYGVIHRGHWYGTLDTIDDYYWGGYVATQKRKQRKPA